jgi:predicted Rossmann-fold nucleotide-binding protein
MSWLLRILTALGIALALVIVIVVVIGNWGTPEETTQALTMTVGNRTVTIAGHYKDMTQESIADGISVDGKTEVLEPDQDVMIYVSEDGDVQVKVVQADERASEEAP